MRIRVEYRVGDFIKKDTMEMRGSIRTNIQLTLPKPLNYLLSLDVPYPLEMRALTFILDRYDEKNNTVYYILDDLRN